MRTWACLGFLFVALGAAGLTAEALAKTETKIALHAVPHTRNPACAPTAFPCNPGESYLTTSAATMTGYDVYFIIVDAIPHLGIAGASFGISYDAAPGSGIDVMSWTTCGDNAFADVLWPAAGSGNLITWDRINNCQNTPVSGDSLHQARAVLGIAYVYAYSADILAVTGRGSSDRIEVANCTATTTEIWSPRARGKVAFGENRHGWDPCNPYETLSDFVSLSAGHLDSLQIWVSPLDSGRFEFVLHGPDGPDANLLDRFALSIDRRRSVDATGNSASLSTSELGMVLGRLSSLNPPIREMISWPAVGLTIATWRDGRPIGFATILDTTQTLQFMEDLLEVVGSNTAARPIVFDAVCGLGFMPELTATDVTSDVQVNLSGFEFDRFTDTYVTAVTLTNISVAALQGPIHLLVYADPPSELQAYDGAVCSTDVLARWYLTLRPSGSLGVNESITTTLRFTWTEDGPQRMATWVYSGSSMP